MMIPVKVLLSLLIFYQLLCVRIESVQLQPFRKKLIVSTILDSAYLSLREGHEYFEGNEKFEGFLKGLTDLLAEKIGFTYELRLVKDSAFGHLQNDSTWNGMIGEVLRGEADMAVSSMTINSIRSKYVDFSTAFIELQLGVLMKRPTGPLRQPILNLKSNGKQNTSQFLFLKPLTWPLWTSSIVGIIVTTGMLYILEWAFHNKIRVRSWMTNNPANSGNLDEAIGEFQFSLYQTKSLAGQLLRITLLIFTTIIVSGYISHFYCAQHLTSNIQNHKVRRSRFAVTTIEELARKNNQIKFSVIAHGSTAHYLQKSSNPTLRRIYRGIMADNSFVKSVAHGVDLVVSSENGSYAFITEELTAKYISSHVCNAFVATYPFGPQIGFGVVVLQNSTLLRRINLAIAEMKDDLTLTKLENEWLVDSGKCNTGVKISSSTRRRNNQSPKPRAQLNMQNSAGMFYIWIFLLLSSAAAALLEVHLFTNRILNGSNVAAGSPEVIPRVGEVPETVEMAEVQL